MSDKTSGWHPMDANVEPGQEEEAVTTGADHAAGPDETVASTQGDTGEGGESCDCFVCYMRRVGIDVPDDEHWRREHEDP